LAEIALKGKNTIMCAGTNAGKTYVAFHIIEDHLLKNPKGNAYINEYIRTYVLTKSYCFVIPFVGDLRQVGEFIRVLRFPPPIQLTENQFNIINKTKGPPPSDIGDLS
jgi:hypothetical protein